MFLASGPYGDFDVLTQSREKFHEASDGKVARAISHQQRDFRLSHVENFGDLNLCHAAVLQDCVDLQGELGLKQLLFGVCTDPRVILGRRVRQLRLERRLSQEKLAELADLHRNHVGVERGEQNISIINIVKLANGLNVRPTKLIEPIR